MGTTPPQPAACQVTYTWQASSAHEEGPWVNWVFDLDGGQLSDIVGGMSKVVLDKMNKECKAKEAIQVGIRRGGG